MVSSVSGANGTGGLLMAFGFRFHGNQQRELVLFGQLLGRLYLRFGYIVRIDAGQPHPRLVHAHHDRKRLAARLVKDRFENPDDEVLGRIVVIVQENAPHAGRLQLPLLTLLSQGGFFGKRVAHPTTSFYKPVIKSSSILHGEGTGGCAAPVRTRRTKSARAISRAPREARCPVAI